MCSPGREGRPLTTLPGAEIASQHLLVQHFDALADRMTQLEQRASNNLSQLPTGFQRGTEGALAAPTPVEQGKAPLYHRQGQQPLPRPQLPPARKNQHPVSAGMGRRAPARDGGRQPAVRPGPTSNAHVVHRLLSGKRSERTTAGGALEEGSGRQTHQGSFP
jgi:hypothetical protein